MHKYRPLCSRQTRAFLQMLLEKSAKNQVEGIYFNFSKTHAKLLLSQDSVLSWGKKGVLPILTGVQRVSGRGCFRISLSNQPGTLELPSCPVLPQQAWEPASLSSHFSCAGTAVCVAEQGTRAANWWGPGAATLCRAEVAKRETSVGLWPSEIAAEKEEDKRWFRKWHNAVPQRLLSSGNVSTVLKSANAFKDQLGHVQGLKEKLS